MTDFANGQSRSGVEVRRETAGFVLPEPAETLDLTMDDGAPIRVVRHGNPAGPRVVLSHGNGFASDSYFPFWRLMLERFDLALFDFRNCGRNPFHASSPHNYSRFVRDYAEVHGAIVAEMGEKTTIGVFHSLSAITALLATCDGTRHWDALLLFDPPVVPPEGSQLRDPFMTAAEMLRDAARARQNRFRNPGELADVFCYLNRFRRLRKGVAELNARSVLRFDPACEDWQLCCPGQVEANLYTEAAELPIWRKPGPHARPLMIVGSDPEPEDAWKTAACCRLFCETFDIDYAVVPDTSHLLQLEEPEQCFALFSGFLADNGIGE